jgi:replicative DNA helicase
VRVPSSEALLISSVINTGDFGAVAGRGVGVEHFAGFAIEWTWLNRYIRDYREIPSADVMNLAFPEFPYRSSATEVAFFADQVIERSNQRAVKTALLAASQALATGNTEVAMSTMSAVRLTAICVPPIDAMRSHLVADELDAESDTGVAFPWSTLQQRTGGLRPGDFCVYGARTGIGKSWALAYTAVNAAMLGLSVCYYSLEMPKEQIIARLHCLVGTHLGYRISHTSLVRRTVDRILYKRLLADMEAMVPGTVNVVDSGAGRISPSSVGANRADLVIIDHLGLMTLSDGRRAIDDWRAMARISNEVKEQTIAAHVPVASAAQLNRQASHVRTPTAAEIAQSDAIGQDADVLVMLRRMAGPVLRYDVAKNRHGPSEIRFFSHFDPDYGHLGEVSQEQAQDICDDAAE